MSEVIINPDDLLVQHNRLSLQIQSESARLSIEADVAAAMRKFEFSGIDVAPKDARKKITDELYARYDTAVTADLIAFDDAYQRTVADLERRLAASRRPPALTLSDPKTSQAVLAWTTLLRGASLADLLAEYEASEDPVLHHLVESRDYTRIFGLTDGGRSSTETAATGFKLASAITARQDRRQNAGVAETLATLKAARARDLALNHRIREARNARGAAIKIASRYYTEPLTA